MAIDVRGNYTVGTHALVRLDKVLSGEAGNLESVVHTADMDQGTVVCFGGAATIASKGGVQREVVNVKVPATVQDLTLEAFGIVVAPEINYNEVGFTERDFYIQTGEVARGYNFNVGDVVTVALSQIDGTPVLGQFVTPQGGSLRLKASVDAQLTIGGTTFTPRLVFKVMKADSKLGGRLAGWQDSVRLKVVKA